MDLVKLHKKAGEQVTKFIADVKHDQWGSQSNCTEWSVRDLINHIVSENLWMPEMLVGQTIDEVGDKYEGDVLGRYPLKAFEQSQKAADEAIAKPDALKKVVHLSYGDYPASLYISHRIVDLVVHGWDIAKSTGQEDNLDDELIQAAYEIIEPEVEDWRKSGILGPKIGFLEDADLQTKLLAIMGRKR